MRRYLLFCALGALLGCRTVSEPSGTAIALFCSTYQGAKTESLTVGEEVAVFAGPEGTEDYFLEAVKFIVGSDGRSLTYDSTVYYPDPKQAVTFTAYLPFGGTWDGALGTFSVPTDQSSALALKQADLCGAVASTTPVATPVALEFKHLLARLVITTNEPTTKIVFPNALASGVLHAATAQFVLGTVRKDIWTESTTSNELIVPVQPLSRLVLTVSNTVLGVVSKTEYVFDTAPIALEAGRTTTLNLTLHPSTKTATLLGSSVTNWDSANGEGNPNHAVANVLTLHWSNHLLQGATPDKVIFTIGGTDYTVSSGITYADKTFIVPFASAVLRYPYTINKIDFYQAGRLVQSCDNLLGGAIIKSGACVVGIRQWPTVPNPPTADDYVILNSLKWAKGNLVAVNKSNAKIGKPMDGGLYFQFGSLIGYKGGAVANGGTGVGSNPYIGSGTQWWGGISSFSWSNDAMVWPSAMITSPIAWPSKNGSAAGDCNTVVNQWFFNYNTYPYSTESQNIRGLATPFVGDAGTGSLATGRYAKWGIGDPCTYYLGGTWRLPTTDEYAKITGWASSSWVAWTTPGITGRWAKANETFNKVTGPGAWFGSGLNANVGTPTAVNPFFPASGQRHPINGSFASVTTLGYGWSSSVKNAAYGYGLTVFESHGVVPKYYEWRSFAFPVRCVSN